MNCQGCKFEITSNMVHAVKQNMCPVCGDKIMSSEKLQQYTSLRRVLSRQQLTNNPSAEAKLCERIIALLLEHFDFTLIQDVELNEDLIDLDVPATDSEPEVEMTEEVVPLSTQNESGGNPRRISREGSTVRDQKHVLPIEDGDSGVNQMRREVYAETYGEQGDGDGNGNTILRDTETGDEIDLEEAKGFFPGQEEEVGTDTATEQVQSLQEVARSGKSEGRVRRMK